MLSLLAIFYHLYAAGHQLILSFITHVHPVVLRKKYKQPPFVRAYILQKRNSNPIKTIQDNFFGAESKHFSSGVLVSNNHARKFILCNFKGIFWETKKYMEKAWHAILVHHLLSDIVKSAVTWKMVHVHVHVIQLPVSQVQSWYWPGGEGSGGGGARGESHMEQMRMLVGNFEFNA